MIYYRNALQRIGLLFPRPKFLYLVKGPTVAVGYQDEILYAVLRLQG